MGVYAAAPPREAYFGPDEGWRETPLVTRGELAGGPHAGPLIVEEYDATAVIPPGWAVSLDAWGNIVAVREAHAIGDPS